MLTPEPTLLERIQQIQDRISQACSRAGRSIDDITLIAVSKKHPPESVQAASDEGLVVFGENRVQEAAQKIPVCPSHLDWHLIGHLQSNKAKLVPELFSTVHSVDSIKLMRILNNAAAEHGRKLNIFIQTNVSGEAVKFGCPPEELEAFLEVANDCQHIHVAGLMTMPPAAEDLEKTRPHFTRLRELRDELALRTGFPLESLSMGMSYDMEVAIEEGATHVRVGTAIFGKRPPLQHL